MLSIVLFLMSVCLVYSLLLLGIDRIRDAFVDIKVKMELNKFRKEQLTTKQEKNIIVKGTGDSLDRLAKTPPLQFREKPAPPPPMPPVNEIQREIQKTPSLTPKNIPGRSSLSKRPTNLRGL